MLAEMLLLRAYMNAGSVFEYEATIERSDEGIVEVFIERYDVSAIAESSIVYRKISDKMSGAEEVEEPNLCYYVGSDLHREGTASLDTVLGRTTTDVFDSDRCGGGETVYVGPDNIVYMSVRTQLWSKGVRYSETRVLTAIELR